MNAGPHLRRASLRSACLRYISTQISCSSLNRSAVLVSCCSFVMWRSTTRLVAGSWKRPHMTRKSAWRCERHLQATKTQACSTSWRMRTQNPSDRTDTSAGRWGSHLQKQGSMVHEVEDMDSSALPRQLHSRLQGDESAPCRHGGSWLLAARHDRPLGLQPSATIRCGIRARWSLYMNICPCSWVHPRMTWLGVALPLASIELSMHSSCNTVLQQSCNSLTHEQQMACAALAAVCRDWSSPLATMSVSPAALRMHCSAGLQISWRGLQTQLLQPQVAAPPGSHLA